MHINEAQIKDFLLDARLITPTELSRVEKKAKERKAPFEECLISEGKITLDNLNKIHAHILGIPFISLAKDPIPFDTLSLIPEPVARHNNIIAFKKTDKELEVAMLDIDDLASIEFIRKKTGLKILPRLTDEESMARALSQYQKTLKAEFDDIIQKEAAAIRVVRDSSTRGFFTEKEEDPTKLAEDLPIIKIVDTLLSHAVVGQASDIHIEPGEEGVLVRYRIDGILRDVMTLPVAAAPGVSARIKVLSNLKLDEKRLPQDGRFKIKNENEEVSFRVSTLPTYFGEKIVMRLLRESVSGFNLEKLGFYGEALERLHKASRQKTGIILATGPTGSGKTTTLYTMLDIVNTPEVNISTVEDPIEYQMKRVNQTQVKPEIGLTFANGLRSLLRQDPDIIMVGEIRDRETAALAINAALTGHLVLSTLHTNSAAGSVARLIDMGVEPFLLVSTLHTVIGQRLVRRIGSEHETYTLNKEQLDALGELVDLTRILTILKKEKIVGANDTWQTIKFFYPKKSAEGDGYSSRIGIHEVLAVSDAIKALIMKGAPSQEVETQAKKEGMVTMIEDGVIQAVRGITTIEEVLRVVSE